MMVVKFLDIFNEQVIKESLLSNIVLPRTGDTITYMERWYTVIVVDFNYNNGVITVNLT